MKTSLQIAEMIDSLPNDDQALVIELVKRLVRAWDPDFSKVTPAERADIDAGREEIQRGESFSDEEIEKLLAKDESPSKDEIDAFLDMRTAVGSTCK